MLLHIDLEIWLYIILMAKVYQQSLEVWSIEDACRNREGQPCIPEFQGQCFLSLLRKPTITFYDIYFLCRRFMLYAVWETCVVVWIIKLVVIVELRIRQVVEDVWVGRKVRQRLACEGWWWNRAVVGAVLVNTSAIHLYYSTVDEIFQCPTTESAHI